MTLNNEVRCHSLNFNPTDSIEVESIERITIDVESYKICSNCSFNRIKCLLLIELSTEEIKTILPRFKRVDALEMSCSSLESIYFSPFRVRQFEFKCVSFKQPVYMPREIDKLLLTNCEALNLIRAQRVNEIDFKYYEFGKNPMQYEKLAKTLKGVKVASINKPLADCYLGFPSTLRRIHVEGLHNKVETLKKMNKHFPYLIQTNCFFQAKQLDDSKLRVINPILSYTREKFKLRPRKITVDLDNATEVSNHPELFEKVEYVAIYSNKFNFDVLPSKIKKIEIDWDVDEESVVLNRFEKECK